MSRPSRAQSPRKPPKQARSRATVNAILDGCIRVLDQEGAEAATTSRIAEVAGVSVGTLYQYFSNRDAIIDALQDREFERAGEMLGAELGRKSPQDGRALARSVVAGLLKLYRNAPGLHRVLVLDGLRVAPTDRVQAFDRRMVELLRVFFDTTPLPIRRKNHQAAAFVLYHSVRASMLGAILEEPAGVTDQLLIDEVTDLVVAHLIGDDAQTIASNASTIE